MAGRPEVAASTPAPSHYQRAVLDFVATGTGHGVVRATAGSGKTSTLVQVARLLEPRLLSDGRQACFLAFNRATAAELRARLPESVEATTLHALGRGMLARAYPTLTLGAPSAGKYARLAAVAAGGRGLPTTPEVTAYLARLAQFARLELTDVASQAAIADVASRYRLEAPLVGDELAALHGCLAELLGLGAAAIAHGEIDFTDMVYLCVRLGLPAPNYAFVCVDEAQDLSAMALALVGLLLAAGARALFVGDPRQAIYAFAGADSHSLPRILERTAATELPLSVSYRCPVRHVVLARRFAPEMEPRPQAPGGSVRLLASRDLAGEVAPGDLLIARTNQDLIAWALRLATLGLRTRVLGSDLAERTLELAETLFEAGVYDDAPRRIAESAAAETARLERDLIVDLRLPGALQRSSEAHAALTLAVERLRRAARSVDHESVAAEVAKLFAGTALEAAPPVVLSTIHRAKGREAERVFLLDADALAAAPAGSDDDNAAEANVLFVALTRAKRELVFVEGQPGAIRRRLSAAQPNGPDLPRFWNDVLRLAMRMDGAPRDRRSRVAGRIIRGWLRTLSTRFRAASSSSWT